MIIQARRRQVADLLLRAAKNRGTLSFRELLSLFTDKQIKDGSAYRTLEAAAGDLAPREKVLYEAVMAKAGTGLPGDGFFDAYSNRKPEEYRRIAGRTMVQDLTIQQKAQIVELERKLVYEHAKLNY